MAPGLPGYQLSHSATRRLSQAPLYTAESKPRPTWRCQSLPSVRAVPASRSQARASAPQKLTLPCNTIPIPIFSLEEIGSVRCHPLSSIPRQRECHKPVLAMAKGLSLALPLPYIPLHSPCPLHGGLSAHMAFLGNIFCP